MTTSVEVEDLPSLEEEKNISLNTSSEDVCPICQYEIKQENQPTYTTTCSHKFHARCIFPWINEHHTCPLCRTTQTREDITNGLISNNIPTVRVFNWNIIETIFMFIFIACIFFLILGLHIYLMVQSKDIYDSISYEEYKNASNHINVTQKPFNAIQRIAIGNQIGIFLSVIWGVISLPNAYYVNRLTENKFIRNTGYYMYLTYFTPIMFAVTLSDYVYAINETSECIAYWNSINPELFYFLTRRIVPIIYIYGIMGLPMMILYVYGILLAISTMICYIISGKLFNQCYICFKYCYNCFMTEVILPENNII